VLFPFAKTEEAVAKPSFPVTPAKVGVQKSLNNLDSRLRGNDISRRSIREIKP